MRTLITHDGFFHTDDVFATATIMLAHPGEEFEIIRTRKEEWFEKGDIVYDIGRIYDESKNRFDHHQKDAPKREDNIPFASFGLVWKKFGKNICSDPEVLKIIENRLVKPIDLIDNGIDISLPNNLANNFNIKNYSIGDLVFIFNQSGLEEGNNFSNFIEMVSFAKRIIEREVFHAKESIFTKEEVKKVYEDSAQKEILVFDKKLSYGEELSLNYPAVIFYVYPYSENNWAVKGVRKSKEGFEIKKKLPESWAGKNADELKNLTGVFDARFCHNGLFIATAESKEGAIALAKLALDNNG